MPYSTELNEAFLKTQTHPKPKAPFLPFVAKKSSLGQVSHSHCHGFAPSCLPDWLLLCDFLKSPSFCVPEVRGTLSVPAELHSLLNPPLLDSGTPLVVSLLSLCFLMISPIFQVILLYREELHRF